MTKSPGSPDLQTKNRNSGISLLTVSLGTLFGSRITYLDPNIETIFGQA
jgi:hypothetical protein